MTLPAVRMHLHGNQNPDNDYDDFLMMLCLLKKTRTWPSGILRCSTPSQLKKIPKIRPNLNSNFFNSSTFL